MSNVSNATAIRSGTKRYGAIFRNRSTFIPVRLVPFSDPIDARVFVVTLILASLGCETERVSDIIKGGGNL